MLLYIDSERCNNLTQLRRFFSDGLIVVSNAYDDFLDYGRHGELSCWLREIGETDIADKIDAINPVLSDFDYVSKLGFAITGEPVRVIQNPDYLDYHPKGCIMGELENAMNDLHIKIKNFGDSINKSVFTLSRDFTINDVSFKMIKVEASHFNMGDETYDNCKIHEVFISNDYYIGETVVTQELWESIMGNNPSHFIDKKNLLIVLVGKFVSNLFTILILKQKRNSDYQLKQNGNLLLVVVYFLVITNMRVVTK